MGIMEVTREAHQDFTTTDSRWKSVTFEPVETLLAPVSLKMIKAEKPLQGIALVRQPQVAVSEITESEFQIIRQLEQNSNCQNLCNQKDVDSPNGEEII